MIPPPTAVGGPTASNRHRILEEKIQNTEYKSKALTTKYKTQNENQFILLPGGGKWVTAGSVFGNTKTRWIQP